MNFRVHIGDPLTMLFAFEAAAKGSPNLIKRAARVEINQLAGQPLGFN